MAGKISIYNWGDLGVDLVKSPIHLEDGAWTSLQNAEFPDHLGQGGMKKRGGLSRVNASALAGGVQAMSNVPFAYPGSTFLMLALNTGETNAWDKSTDGASFSGLTTSQLQRYASIGKIPTGASSLFAASRPASFQRLFYYPGDNYTLASTSPTVVVWDGTTAYEMFRIPTNPSAAAGTVPLWISDFFIADGLIYIAVYDSGGTAPDKKGRVFEFDPTNGTLTQLGNAFGDGSGENTKGFPFCLASYLGQIFVGTYGISGNNLGRVYRILPGVDESWTLDLAATLHNGYFMSMAVYQGNLYVGTDADSSGTSIIQKRTSTGTWSTSFTAPASNVSYCAGLIVYNNLLFACYYKSGSACLIKKFDGSSWTTDLDVAATYALKPPASPYVFGSGVGDLYWPFMGSESSESSTAGFLLKRDSAGVWTRPLNSVGIRGGLGTYTPPGTA